MRRLPLVIGTAAGLIAALLGVALLVSSQTGSGRPDGSASEAASSPSPLVAVLRVVDGDTLWVDGPEERVRLIGIDAPEVDWHGGRAECYGDEAGRFMQDLLLGKRVRLELDREERDRFGRTLAYVYLEDGRMVNVLLVRRGFAQVVLFPPNDRYEDRLVAAEAEARGAGHGLWRAC